MGERKNDPLVLIKFIFINYFKSNSHVPGFFNEFMGSTKLLYIPAAQKYLYFFFNGTLILNIVY